jgi:hypothetical protein
VTGIGTVQFTHLDAIPSGTIGSTTHAAYGTFQSHNQKTVANSRGIFTAYLQDYIPAADGNDVGTWTLKMSTDGGTSFGSILTETDGAKAPCIETDASGNIHIAYPTNSWRDIYYIQLLASENYTPPHSIIVPGAGAGKYSCSFNMARNEFYYLGWSKLVRIDAATMTVIDNRTFFENGPNGLMQYPHLSFEPTGQDLAVAWTTVSPVPIGASGSLYKDARYLTSGDYGGAWQIPTTGDDARLPVVVDDTGPAPQALLPPDYTGAAAAQAAGNEWENWLDDMAFADGYFFFMYNTYGSAAPDAGVRYVRTSLTSSSPSVSSLHFRGDSLEISSLGTFFVTQPAPGGGHFLYAVGGSPEQRLVVLMSRDDGVSWHDFAASEPRPNPIYAVSGSRVVSPDGYITGAYTAVAKPGEDHGGVEFFKVRAFN